MTAGAASASLQLPSRESLDVRCQSHAWGARDLHLRQRKSRLHTLFQRTSRHRLLSDRLVQTPACHRHRTLIQECTPQAPWKERS